MESFDVKYERYVLGRLSVVEPKADGLVKVLADVTLHSKISGTRDYTFFCT
jgi:hypothetical protein